MRSSHSNSSAIEPIAIGFHSANRGNVGLNLVESIVDGFYFAESINDFAKVVLDNGKPAGNVVLRSWHWFIAKRWSMTAQDCSQIAGMPVERERQRFQGASAAASLDRIVLD